MIADVRFKVTMRLRALLERMYEEYCRDAGVKKAIQDAKTDPEIAAQVRARYRSRVVREFAGCTITFTPLRILVYLPNRYPSHNVPITAVYSASLSGAFFAHVPDLSRKDD